jgi:hypothetical protein
MLEVIIRHVGSEVELGRITIENLTEGDGELADYSIRFGVDRHEAVGVHQRAILAFPRHKYNVFGLLLQALNTLDPRELELDGEIKAGLIRKKYLGWRGL